MTIASIWDALCKEHGGLSHAVLHEAGHAVVAVKAGIAFVDVSVNWDPREHSGDLGLVGGGVNLASPEALEAVVKADIVSSLQFCLAGALAEKAGFGHLMSDSYKADVNVWRNHAGLLHGQSEESLEEALGMRIGAVVTATNELLAANAAAVTAVARELGWRANLTLTWAEVRDVVEAATTH